jgi:hypothetical protein
MMNIHGQSVWKLVLGMVSLLAFMGLGLGHLIWPDYFMKRSPVRRGGELLTEWNRTGFQFVGLIIIIFSGGILYELARDFFNK